jgi:hypothetical protein
MHKQFLGTAVVCKSEHWGFKKAKERWDIASLGAKDFKSDYAKEQLRENMGQSKSKEKGFKKGFKENFRSKVLKNCKE